MITCPSGTTVPFPNARENGNLFLTISLAVTVFIPALDSELLLVAEITAPALFCTSHCGYRITSRLEGCAVAIALATPKLPSHGNRGFPLEGADDFGH
jgi:hypothetical protein